jgi:hypothetical protein
MTTDKGSGTGISGTLTSPAPMRRRVDDVRLVAVRRVPVVLADEVRTLAGALGADAGGAIPHTLQ